MTDVEADTTVASHGSKNSSTQLPAITGGLSDSESASVAQAKDVSTEDWAVAKTHNSSVVHSPVTPRSSNNILANGSPIRVSIPFRRAGTEDVIQSHVADVSPAIRVHDDEIRRLVFPQKSQDKSRKEWVNCLSKLITVNILSELGTLHQRLHFLFRHRG
jgi:hypothetical protein